MSQTVQIPSPRPTRSALTLVVLALLGQACGGDFLPESYLNNLRVLALIPSPQEAGPGETVTVEPHVYIPAGEKLDQASWSFCPLSAGAVAGYACAVPACQTPLSPGADGRVRADPHALSAACLAALGGALPPTPGGAAGGALPAVLETVFRLRVRSTDGDSREAALRLPLHTGAPPASRNRPPAIAALEVEGKTAAPGTPLPAVAEGDSLSLTVRIDPASLDTFADEAGRQRTEEPVTSFYATAGRFDNLREVGVTVTGTWKAAQLEAGQDRAEFYLVVRDLRGGQALAGPLTVPITRQ